MPTRAARHCTTPGCDGAPGRRQSKCPRCLEVRARPRPSSTELGYDEEWRELSEAIRAARPVCERCRRRRSRHVDHIDGDNRNNDPANLAALCVPCHSRKTAARDGGFGNPRAHDPPHDPPPF